MWYPVLLDPRPPNVAVRRGSHNQISGKKQQITCGNAARQAIPPMVISEGKNLNYDWTLRETLCGMSGKARQTNNSLNTG